MTLVHSTYGKRNYHSFQYFSIFKHCPRVNIVNILSLINVKNTCFEIHKSSLYMCLYSSGVYWKPHL